METASNNSLLSDHCGLSTPHRCISEPSDRMRAGWIERHGLLPVDGVGGGGSDAV